MLCGYLSRTSQMRVPRIPPPATPIRIPKIMSITRVVAKKKQKDRDLSNKALKEFLAKGGKIQEIPEGEITEAANMKFRYRKSKKKKVPKE
jgi:hypothetical protein